VLIAAMILKTNIITEHLTPGDAIPFLDFPKLLVGKRFFFRINSIGSATPPRLKK